MRHPILDVGRRFLWLALPLGLLALAGCSKGEKPLFAVTGEVTLDGEPVSGGAVLLIDKEGAVASAALGADGTFTLKCPTGTYQIAVSPPPPPDPLVKQAAAAAAAAPIPRAYHEVATSGLTVEVADENVSLEIPLDSSFGGA